MENALSTTNVKVQTLDPIEWVTLGHRSALFNCNDVIELAMPQKRLGEISESLLSDHYWLIRFLDFHKVILPK